MAVHIKQSSSKRGVMHKSSQLCKLPMVQYILFRSSFVYMKGRIVCTDRLFCLFCFKPSGRTEEKRLHQNQMIVQST